MATTVLGSEFVSCNLCGSAATRPFAHKQGMQVVQCVACGLVYVNPRLSPSELDEHYNSDQSSRTQYYLDVEVADRRTFNEFLDVAEQHCPDKGDLLDVGPNIGTCLTLARERGWKGHGVEINREAARYCREERGLDVIGGILEADTYPANSFNVVLMGDVIEHVPDPLSLMRVIARILRPDGCVLISTPNIGSMAGRALQIKPMEHIYYFAPPTMDILLRKAGLEVVKIGALDRYHNLTAMTHSTTFGGLFQKLAPVFDVAHRMMGDLVLKLPLRENLIAVARKPAKSLLRAA
jgi:2-polyprenyl-3-methyl-5-hydroxy-6-metoxy-1,4-benzoquinol methylase